MGHQSGIPNVPLPGPSSGATTGRYERSKKRKRKQLLTPTEDKNAVSSDDDQSLESGEAHGAGEVESGVSTMTDLSVADISHILTDNAHLREEVTCLKDKLKKVSLDEDSFCGNDDKVLFYTGLPTWCVLAAVLAFVSNHLSQSGRCALTPFQQLLLTLMKLRLNLPAKDLAVRFGVGVATVSRTFLCTLNVLFWRLKPLIIWPERDSLLKTMPMCFRRYCPRAAVIIDCFEIFVDRPLNPLARAQLWSHYKHHCTVKFLIGITPQGTVSFISDAWGGRVSDKKLTEESGLMELLTPGDVILADRGFDINESVGLYLATIRIPAFTRGKKQLSAIEVEQTRRIANVRIHVERVIGLLRNKYAILSATQPIDHLTVPSDSDVTETVGKIVTVCCALINMCDSVIPSD